MARLGALQARRNVNGRKVGRKEWKKGGMEGWKGGRIEGSKDGQMGRRTAGQQDSRKEEIERKEGKKE